MLAVPGRAAGRGDPRRQQRARPRDRPARGQAHAGGAARAASARAGCYARDASGAFATAPLPWLLGGDLAPGCCCRWLALPLAAPLVRIVRNRTDGPALNGALAGTGRLQLAFCVAALGRAAPRADDAALASRAVARAARAAAAAWGELRERELLRVRLDRPDGLPGVGEAAPLEPYDGVALAAVRAALDAYAARARASRPTPTADALRAPARAERDLPQALAAIDLALWDPAGAPGPAPGRARSSTRARRDAVPVNATIGAATARAPRPRPPRRARRASTA